MVGAKVYAVCQAVCVVIIIGDKRTPGFGVVGGVLKSPEGCGIVEPIPLGYQDWFLLPSYNVLVCVKTWFLSGTNASFQLPGLPAAASVPLSLV
jgi:hypothetical protein